MLKKTIDCSSSVHVGNSFFISDIDKVYIEIYSNLKTMFTSSIEHSMIFIENRPIQLGCFCEKINVPIHVNYEYT